LSGRLVGRYAEDHGPGVLQFLVRFAEPASFNGSPGCIGLGKKEEDNGLAAKILQRHRFFVLVEQSEVRGFIIDVHGVFSVSLKVIQQDCRARHPGRVALPYTAIRLRPEFAEHPQEQRTTRHRSVAIAGKRQAAPDSGVHSYRRQVL
jgi:hypothetical protein